MSTFLKKTAQSLKRITRTIRTKNTLTFNAGSLFFKIYIGRRGHDKCIADIRAGNYTQEKLPWAALNSIHPDYALAAYFFSFAVFKNAGSLHEDKRLCLEHATLIREHTPTNVESKKWIETTHPRVAKYLLSQLNQDKKDFIEKNIGHLNFPVTGSHGDLSPKNLLFTENGEHRIIDWEYYNVYGSVIEDLAYLVCFTLKTKNSPSVNIRELFQLKTIENYFPEKRCCAIILYILSQSIKDLDKKGHALALNLLEQRIDTLRWLTRAT